MARQTRSQFRFHGPLEAASGALAELRIQDKLAERGKQLGCQTGCGGCLGVVVCLFLFFGSGQPLFQENVGVGHFCLLFTLSLTIFGMFLHSHHEPYDLDDHRYQVPEDLLLAIGVDLDLAKPVRLEIDFRPSHLAPVATLAQPTSSVRVWQFRHCWLNLAAVTASGYRLKLSVTRQGSYKIKPKRKQDKTVLRYRDVVVVSVRPPADAPAPKGAIDNPHGVNWRFSNLKCQVDAEGTQVRVDTGEILRLRSRREDRSSGEDFSGRDLLPVCAAAFRPYF